MVVSENTEIRNTLVGGGEGRKAELENHDD